MLANHSLERYGVRMTLKYSTVDEYFQVLTDTTKETTYPVFEGDFFPYL